MNKVFTMVRFVRSKCDGVHKETFAYKCWRFQAVVYNFLSFGNTEYRETYLRRFTNDLEYLVFLTLGKIFKIM